MLGRIPTKVVLYLVNSLNFNSLGTKTDNTSHAEIEKRKSCLGTVNFLCFPNYKMYWYTLLSKVTKYLNEQDFGIYCMCGKTL